MLLPLQRGIYTAQEHSRLCLAKVCTVSFYEAAFCEQNLGTLPSLQTASASLPFFPCSPYLAPSKQQGCQGLQVLGSLVPENSSYSLEWTSLEKHRGTAETTGEGRQCVLALPENKIWFLSWSIVADLQTHRFSCSQAILTSSKCEIVWGEIRN